MSGPPHAAAARGPVHGGGLGRNGSLKMSDLYDCAGYDDADTGTWLGSPTASSHGDGIESIPLVEQLTSPAENPVRTQHGTTASLASGPDNKLNRFSLQPSLSDQYSTDAATLLPRAQTLSSDAGDHYKALWSERTPDEASIRGDDEPGEAEPERVNVHAEVRATVPNDDDPTMPFNTLRTWFISICTGLGLSSAIFYLDMHSDFGNATSFIGAVLVQPLAYGVGKLMSFIPYSSDWPLAWFINPGPFNLKEHTVCTMVAAVATGPNLTTWFLGSMLSAFAGHNTSHAFENSFPDGFVLLAYLSTPMVGFALGGLASRFLVWPGKLIWPEQLQTAAMLTSLHGVRRGNWSRRKVFWIVAIVALVYEWIPQLIYRPLATFSWPTWLAPESYGINLVFGGTSGMGLSFLALDWITVIAALGSPLYVPWHAILNVFCGFLGAAVLVPIVLIFSNSNMAAYLPYSQPVYAGNTFSWVMVNISSGGVKADKPLPQGLAIDPDTILADGNSTTGRMTALLTSSTAWAYAACTALLVHTSLFHSKEIKRWWQLPSPSHSTDPHTRLLGNYKQVPMWWHWVLLAVSLIFALPMVHVYRTSVPIWAVFFAVLVAAIFIVPVGIVQGLSAVQIKSVDYLASLLVGLLLPHGSTTAMYIFQLYSGATVEQAMLYCGCAKLALYFKIPPRVAFVVVVASQVVCSVWQYGLWSWLGGVPGGSPGLYAHTSGLYDPIYWMGLGPFRSGFINNYAWVLCFLLVGAILPLMVYAFTRLCPRPMGLFRASSIHIPLFFGGSSGLALYAPSSWTAWFFYGTLGHFIFMRPAQQNYWLGLNYVLSAALNVGASVCAAVSSGMFLGWATKGTPLNELYVPNLYSNGSITLTTGRTRDTSGQGIIWKHLSEGQPNR